MLKIRRSLWLATPWLLAFHIAAAEPGRRYECQRLDDRSRVYEQYGMACPVGTRDLLTDPAALAERAARERARRQAELRAQQDRDNDWVAMRGELRMGMTREQAIAAWGLPLTTSMVQRGAGGRGPGYERWTYRANARLRRVHHHHLYFRDGRLAAWELNR